MSDTIAVGTNEDVQKLLENFAATKSLLYKDFVTEWQKMQFALIYLGRATLNELVEFTEELFEIVKKFLLPVHSVNYRVGALYLLYGLYFRQPTQTKFKGFLKIRLEIDEWTQLIKLVNELKGHGYLDVCYIFNRMVANGAFHFTCFSKMYGLENPNQTIVMKSIEKEADYEKDLTRKRDGIINEILVESNFAKMWQNNEKKYNELKADILKNGMINENTIKVDDIDFIDDLKKSILSSNDNTTSFDSSINIGERRQALKKGTNDASSSGNRCNSKKLSRIMQLINQMDNIEAIPTTSKDLSKKRSKVTYFKKIDFINDESEDSDMCFDEESSIRNLDEIGTRLDMPSIIESDLVPTGKDFGGDILDEVNGDNICSGEVETFLEMYNKRKEGGDDTSESEASDMEAIDDPDVVVKDSL